MSGGLRIPPARYLVGCHKLVPVRMAPRTVDGFASACVMKDIWSIEAYSFFVPFR